MNISQLNSQIAKHQQTLQSLCESQTALDQRIAELNGERKGLVLNARTGDEAAKSRLSQIDGEIASAQRERGDDAAAIAELSVKLDGLRGELATATKQAQRARLRSMINCYVDDKKSSQGRIEKMIANLKNALAESIGDADEMLSLLGELGETETWDRIRRSETSARAWIEDELKSLDKFVNQRASAFRSVLGVLDAAYIPGEDQRPTGHKLYAVNSPIQYDGRSIHLGEMLWLFPEDAASLLECGAISEVAAQA